MAGPDDPEDEYWRRRAPRRLPAGPSREVVESVGRLLSRDEALEAIGHERSARTPEGLHPCKRCGVPSRVLHAVATETVVVNGLAIVGAVRTTCSSCFCRLTQREAGQS